MARVTRQARVSPPDRPRRSRTERAPSAAAALLLAVGVAACGGSGGSFSPAGQHPPPPPPPPVAPTPDTATVATRIGFLPPTLTTARQYRPNLIAAGGELFFSDGSDAPLKKTSTAGGPATVLARRMGPPACVAARDGRVLWTVDDALVEADLATSTQRVLATGNLAPSPDLLVDGAGAYWVRTVDGATCSPPCTRRVERVGDAGTAALVETTQRIAGLAQDETSLYWVEDAAVPVTSTCGCGSRIRTLAKAGGSATVLVDAGLNAPLPDLGPGVTPGAWSPVGGLAVDATHVYFARREYAAMKLARVPIAGGAVEAVAEVPRASGYDDSVAPRRLALDATRVYWIDGTRLAAAPLAGGAVETLAGGLSSPVDLVLDGGAALVLEAAGGWDAGRLLRIPLAGGAPTVVATGLDLPARLAADATRLYWAEAWRVAAAPRSGGPAATLASGIDDPYFRIAVAGDDVLVLDGFLLKRVPRAGGTVEKVLVVRNDLGAPSSLAAEDATADAQAVYVAARSTRGAAWRVPLDGGAVTRYALPDGDMPQDCVLRVATDATHVYWTAASTIPLFCRIARAPLGGGPAELLVDAPLFDFALDGQDVFFTEGRVTVTDGTGTHSVGSTGVSRVPAAGGAVEAHPLPGAPFLVATAGGRVFWLDAIGAVGWGDRDLAVVGFAGGGPFEESALFADAFASDGSAVYWTNTLTGEIGKIWFP